MKLLFLLFLALNVIYQSFYAEGKYIKNEEKYKNETILIIPNPDNGNCLNICIVTPNCRLYEEKNGACELTVTRLLNNLTIKKLRVKRKGRSEVSAEKGSSDSISSAKNSRAARSNGGSNSGGGGGNSYRNSNYYGGDHDSDSSILPSNKVMWILLIVAIIILLLAMFFAYMTIRENSKRGSRYRPPQRTSSSAAPPNQEPGAHNVNTNNDMYKHQKPPQFYKKLTYTSKI
jgi:uncharacterized integral membrane protein